MSRNKTTHSEDTAMVSSRRLVYKRFSIFLLIYTALGVSKLTNMVQIGILKSISVVKELF